MLRFCTDRTKTCKGYRHSRGTYRRLKRLYPFEMTIAVWNGGKSSNPPNNGRICSVSETTVWTGYSRLKRWLRSKNIANSMILLEIKCEIQDDFPNYHYKFAQNFCYCTVKELEVWECILYWQKIAESTKLIACMNLKNLALLVCFQIDFAVLFEIKSPVSFEITFSVCF